MKVKARKIENFFKKPQNIILLVLLICLIYLVIFPLFNILQDTFRVHTSEVNRIHAQAGTFTLYHWVTTFAGSNTYVTFIEPLINSLICAILSCVISIIVGGMFAWLVIRTDMRFKKLCSTLFMFLYIMPGWTLAIA